VLLKLVLKFCIYPQNLVFFINKFLTIKFIVLRPEREENRKYEEPFFNENTDKAQAKNTQEDKSTNKTKTQTFRDQSIMMEGTAATEKSDNMKKETKKENCKKDEDPQLWLKTLLWGIISRIMQEPINNKNSEISEKLIADDSDPEVLKAKALFTKIPIQSIKSKPQKSLLTKLLGSQVF